MDAGDVRDRRGPQDRRPPTPADPAQQDEVAASPAPGRRRHAIIEQVIADLKGSALAHLPSGHFAANSAWLVLAAMAFNLNRAAGTLAPNFHSKATTAAIRRQLISVAARITRSARRSTLRLPAAWPWATAWQQLFTAATGPPA